MSWYRREKPRGAGPYGCWPDRPVLPQWVDRSGGRVPAIGGGRSPFLRTQDAREQTYRRMCDSLSNRWRTHRTRSGGGT